MWGCSGRGRKGRGAGKRHMLLFCTCSLPCGTERGEESQFPVCLSLKQWEAAAGEGTMNKLCHSYSQLCQGGRSETGQTPAWLHNRAGSLLKDSV